MASSEAARRSTAVLFANADRTKSPLHDDGNTTARALSSYRVIVAEQIRQCTGRVIRAEGDAILAEFSGPVPAVECAVQIQRELAGRNRELPATSQVRGRVGVSLGDAEQPDGDRFEDGVESATDLAVLAEPGGICISRAVYDEVRYRLNLAYDARKTLASFMDPQQHVHHAPEVSLLEASAVRIGAASIPDQGGDLTAHGHQNDALNGLANETAGRGMEPTGGQGSVLQVERRQVDDRPILSRIAIIGSTTCGMAAAATPLLVWMAPTPTILYLTFLWCFVACLGVIGFMKYMSEHRHETVSFRSANGGPDGSSPRA
jgi:class 3 adenylate cyclase